MNVQKLTQKSIEAVQLAQRTAEENGNQQLLQEHLLFALVTQQEGLIPELLQKWVWTYPPLRRDSKA